MILIDDYSKAAKVYTMEEKNEVYGCIVTYVNLVENLTGKKIKRLRCDNGRGLINSSINKDVYNFAKGIYIAPCPQYVHALRKLECQNVDSQSELLDSTALQFSQCGLNGTAERYNSEKRSVLPGILL